MLQGHLLVLCFILCASAATLSNRAAEAAGVYDVMNYGAIGNSNTDDSQAFLKAWKATCRDRGARGAPTLYIPGGKQFLLSPMNFRGPCNSRTVQVQVSGSIIAPGSNNGWMNCMANSWLSFTNIFGLNIQGSGSGAINGRGSVWWNASKGAGSCYRPIALYINSCHNLVLKGLHHMNSPRSHIAINSCDGTTVSSLSISAPQSSPNTDGIDISHCNHLNMNNLNIQTGDDCIAINGNSSYINITGVFCGPGHGISVGSLGASRTMARVDEVYVRNCTFIGSRFGARIKTWPGGSGYAKNIVFEQIILKAAEYPILIDQFYPKDPNPLDGGVAVSNVAYRGFRGTSATDLAIALNCGRPGCYGITMEHVNITSSSPGKKVVAFCSNASGKASSTVPIVPCLHS